MSKSKWKEIERKLKRNKRSVLVHFPEGPVLATRVKHGGFDCQRIPLRTWRKMWALARNNTHPIINQRTVIL